METTLSLEDRVKRAPLPLIASRIREARGDMSHDTLGQRMGGVTRQHLIKLEQARHRPRVEMLERIAQATGRDVDWFVAAGADDAPFRRRAGRAA